MNNFNYSKKMKKTLALLMLPLTFGASAAEITASLTFDTLPVITIAEDKPIVFGQVLSLAQAEACTLSTTGGTTIVAADEGVTIATPVGGDLTCSTDEGQPGVYTITSAATADIQVSLASATPDPAGIGFVPAGYVVNRAADTRVQVAVGSPVSVEASTTLNGFSPAGTNSVIIGGEVTNQVQLTAGQQYSTTFDIDVIYQ
jgi:hypothetical protein